MRLLPRDEVEIEVNVGRELDSYLARQYFGFRYVQYTNTDEIVGYENWSRYHRGPRVPVPYFCSSDEAADKLIEAVNEVFEVTTERSGDGWISSIKCVLGTYSTYSASRAEAVAVTVAIHARELEKRDVWHRKEFPYVYRGTANSWKNEPFVPSLKTNLSPSDPSADSEGQG